MADVHQSNEWSTVTKREGGTLISERLCAEFSVTSALASNEYLVTKAIPGPINRDITVMWEKTSGTFQTTSGDMGIEVSRDGITWIGAGALDDILDAGADLNAGFAGVWDYDAYTTSGLGLGTGYVAPFMRFKIKSVTNQTGSATGRLYLFPHIS